jgi:predicted  nucleic acid-binding Zn-ribbon protein
MSLHRWLTGLVLVLFMVAALFANAILFSARAFQHNLAQVDQNSGGIVSVAALDQVQEQINAIEAQIAPQRGAAAALEEQFNAAKIELGAITAEVSGQFASVAGQSSALAAKHLAENPPVDMGDLFALNQRIAALEKVNALTPQERKQVEDMRAAAAAMEPLITAHQTKVVELEGLQQQLQNAGASVADSDRQILGLKAQFGEDFDRIRTEAHALQASSPLGVGATLVGMHPTFLSTLLVCLMGALGAILFLFPAYVTRSTEITFVVIVVRMIFGMVTALAFYIVANATLAGFTVGGSGNQGPSMAVSLNPFTVSLLGIIAGVMADDIADWIHSRGRDILGGGARVGDQAKRE